MHWSTIASSVVVSAATTTSGPASGAAEALFPDNEIFREIFVSGHASGAAEADFPDNEIFCEIFVATLLTLVLAYMRVNGDGVRRFVNAVSHRLVLARKPYKNLKHNGLGERILYCTFMFWVWRLCPDIVARVRVCAARVRVCASRCVVFSMAVFTHVLAAGGGPESTFIRRLADLVYEGIRDVNAIMESAMMPSTSTAPPLTPLRACTNYANATFPMGPPMDLEPRVYAAGASRWRLLRSCAQPWPLIVRVRMSPTRSPLTFTCTMHPTAFARPVSKVVVAGC